MIQKTLSQLTTKIENDLDLQAEEFIQPGELTEYFNDARVLAEAIIIKLGLRDRYFLTRTKFDVVEGQEDYPLPVNCNKVVKLIYQNGATLYTLRPIDSSVMFEDIQFLNTYVTTDFYRYVLRNDGPQELIQLVPQGRFTIVNAITLWFYRTTNPLVNPTDICDLPEICYQFLYQSVRVRVYEKEKGQAWQMALADLAKIEATMTETLTQQNTDSDLTEVEKDFMLYQEHS